MEVELSKTVVYAIKPVLAPLITKVTEPLIQLGKEKYLKLRGDLALENLLEKLDTLFKVKTIHETKKPIFLADFYYPTKVQFEEEDLPQQINTLADIPLSFSKNIVIEGTVGHGKSMFMRHLSLNEIIEQSTLPIFFELRKLIKDDSIINPLCSYLSDLIGIKIDHDDFETLAKSGMISIFFDGFDELSDEELIKEIINFIESCSRRFPKMRIICSARPDTAIQKNALFRTLKISKYDRDDQENFIQKLTGNSDITNQLVDKIYTGSAEIQDLLVTPLMLTFFIKTYENKLKIPTSISDFYMDLFDVLMNRHDALKAPYKRTRAIEIEETKLQNIFEEFCLYSKQEGNKLSFDKSFFRDGLQTVLDELKLLIDKDKLIDEYTKNICLILQDGRYYSFVHKSIQEFFIANLIKGLDIDFLENFYTDMQLGRNYVDYRIELQFLSEMDKLNYTKFYQIPSLHMFLEKIKDADQFLNSIYIVDINAKYKIDKKENFYEIFIQSDENFFLNNSYISQVYIIPTLLNEIYLNKKELNLESELVNIQLKDTLGDKVVNNIRTKKVREYFRENKIINLMLSRASENLKNAEDFVASKKRNPLRIKR